MLNSNAFKGSTEFSFDFMDSMSTDFSIRNPNALLSSKMNDREHSFGLVGSRSNEMQSLVSRNNSAGGSLDLPPPPSIHQSKMFAPIHSEQLTSDTLQTTHQEENDIHQQMAQFRTEGSLQQDPTQFHASTGDQFSQPSISVNHARNSKAQVLVQDSAEKSPLEQRQSAQNSPTKAFVIDSSVGPTPSNNMNAIDLTNTHISRSNSPSMQLGGDSNEFVKSLPNDFADNLFSKTSTVPVDQTQMLSQQLSSPRIGHGSPQMMQQQRFQMQAQHQQMQMQMQAQQQEHLRKMHQQMQAQAQAQAPSAQNGVNTSMVITLRHHNYYDSAGNKVNGAKVHPPITLPTKYGNIELTVDHYEFRCIYPDCDKIFELTNDLYDHIRDHHVDWEMKCPKQGCGRQFKCMATLVYHARRHTINKPYICPLPRCSFVTAAKGNLKAHMLSKQHKDIMTLPLINTILSMDTTQARPETYLHPPRHKRILKLGTPLSTGLTGGKRKRETNDAQVLIHPLNGNYPKPAKRARISGGQHSSHMQQMQYMQQQAHIRAALMQQQQTPASLAHQQQMLHQYQQQLQLQQQIDQKKQQMETEMKQLQQMQQLKEIKQKQMFDLQQLQKMQQIKHMQLQQQRMNMWPHANITQQNHMQRMQQMPHMQHFQGFSSIQNNPSQFFANGSSPNLNGMTGGHSNQMINSSMGISDTTTAMPSSLQHNMQARQFGLNPQQNVNVSGNHQFRMNNNSAYSSMGMDHSPPMLSSLPFNDLHDPKFADPKYVAEALAKLTGQQPENSTTSKKALKGKRRAKKRVRKAKVSNPQSNKTHQKLPKQTFDAIDVAKQQKHENNAQSEKESAQVVNNDVINNAIKSAETENKPDNLSISTDKLVESDNQNKAPEKLSQASKSSAEHSEQAKVGDQQPQREQSVASCDNIFNLHVDTGAVNEQKHDHQDKKVSGSNAEGENKSDKVVQDIVLAVVRAAIQVSDKNLKEEETKEHKEKSDADVEQECSDAMERSLTMSLAMADAEAEASVFRTNQNKQISEPQLPPSLGVGAIPTAEDVKKQAVIDLPLQKEHEQQLKLAEQTEHMKAEAEKGKEKEKVAVFKSVYSKPYKPRKRKSARNNEITPSIKNMFKKFGIDLV